MSANPFKQIEDAYFSLRGKLATGRITREEFTAALAALTLEDAQGHRWRLDAASGKWQVNEHGDWVEADPYARDVEIRDVLPAPPPRAYGQAFSSKPRGGNCGGCGVKGCLVSIALLLVAGIGGFVALQSGALTLTTALNWVGLGPANIEVDNFRDERIAVTILQIETPRDAAPAQISFDLKPFDIRTWVAENPGRYRVTFRIAPNHAPLGECTLTLKSGDEYQFVTLPDRLVVNRVNNPVAVGSDLIVASSRLCR